MLPKDFKIQEALGRIQIYMGYVRVNGTDNFIVYEIKSPTYKAARIRLKNICKRQTDDEYTLEHLLKPGETAPNVKITERIKTTI